MVWNLWKQSLFRCLLQMSKAQTKLEELDTALTALAHESRRHILLVVWFRGGSMSAGDIAARFSCTWPTTSRHIRVLEAAGLLELEKQGRSRVYRVNKRKLQLVQEWLHWFEDSPDQTSGRYAPKPPELISVKQVSPRGKKK